MATFSDSCTLTAIAELDMTSVTYARYTPVPVAPSIESYTVQFGQGITVVPITGDYLGCPVTLTVAPQLANQSVVIQQLQTDLVPVIDTSNCGQYYDPRLTDLVFSFVSPISSFNVQLNLNDIFLPVNITRMEIRSLNNGQWQIVPSQIASGVISFQAITGTYAVCLNAYAYSSFTQRMASLLPSWMSIRQNSNSVGQQFLNYFGVDLDNVRGYLDWTLGNLFISQADTAMLDYTYRGAFPINMQPGQALEILGNDHSIAFTTSQSWFRRSNNQLALVDYTNGLIHVKAPYQGYLTIVYSNQEYTMTLAYRQVWNAFDEFALLLGESRRPNESNADLYQRILDVFTYPGNATRLGLYQSIGRALNFVRRLSWVDDSQDFVIYDQNIVNGTMLVDGILTSVCNP